MRSVTYEALGDHLGRVWPGHSAREFTWGVGPIGRSLPHFRVMRLEPPPGGGPWVYASLGAWEVSVSGDPREFFILAPREDPIHVETLAMLANYHADATKPAVDLHHTLDLGRGWVDGSPLTHVLVSLPYTEGPRLEWCEVNGRRVRFLWLLPIWEEEARLARAEGWEALEGRLETSGIDPLDAHRRSVV